MDLGPEPWKFDPGDRDPPPTGPLRTVSALVNTINHGVDDSLDRSGTLELWLHEFDLPGGETPANTSDVARTRELREALRLLMQANDGRPVATAAALRTLERTARAGQLTIAFPATGEAALVPLDPGVDGALAQIVGFVYTAIAAGSWPRVKACRRCGWSYYDHSRNRSSSWCSMRYCGNRTKTTAYRRRRAA